MTRADRDTVHDIIGETILNVYGRMHTLRTPEHFASYCFTTARRVYMRQRRRERLAALFHSTASPYDVSDSTPPDTSLEITILYDALATLPAAMRETLILFEISDCSLEDIRRIQGGTLSGVKSRLARARKQVEEWYARDERATLHQLRTTTTTP